MEGDEVVTTRPTVTTSRPTPKTSAGNASRTSGRSTYTRTTPSPIPKPTTPERSPYSALASALAIRRSGRDLMRRQELCELEAPQWTRNGMFRFRWHDAVPCEPPVRLPMAHPESPTGDIGPSSPGHGRPYNTLAWNLSSTRRMGLMKVVSMVPLVPPAKRSPTGRRVCASTTSEPESPGALNAPPTPLTAI